jgi:HEAT repeat protein
LIILLEDEDVFVRDDAAESLLQLNRPRLVEVWKRALKDLSDDVRNIAIKALTDLGYVEEAIDRLVDLLQDKDFFVRDLVAEWLLQLNRPRLIEVWKQALNDPDEDVRDIAIKAITDLGDKICSIKLTFIRLKSTKKYFIQGFFVFEIPV